jgi:hypothetical protein
VAIRPNRKNDRADKHRLALGRRVNAPNSPYLVLVELELSDASTPDGKRREDQGRPYLWLLKR